MFGKISYKMSAYNTNYENYIFPPNIDPQSHGFENQQQGYFPNMQFINHPPPAYNDPRVKTYRISAPAETCVQSKSTLKAAQQKSDDELMIETWLSKIGKISITLNSSTDSKNMPEKIKKTVHRPQIKISSARTSLCKCLSIIQQLNEAKETLQNGVATLSSAEWKRKTIEIGHLKDELSSLMSTFENTSSFDSLKRNLTKRKKKREMQCRRREERRKKLMREKEEREKLHKDIDRWLEDMKDAVERAKMEENMQREADCVLSEVTKKKSDARKQLSLISALVKLRNVRETAAVARGDKTAPDDAQAFKTNTEKLIKMWEDNLRTYGKEEQGLRIMLENNATEDSKAMKISKQEKAIQQWTYCLFGPKCITSPAYWGLTSAEKDLETFVAIRKSWDTFLTDDDDDQGSKIPIGWVLPPTATNSAWSKYLYV